MHATEHGTGISRGDRLPAEPLAYRMDPADLRAYLGAIPHQGRRYMNASSRAPAALAVARFCDACVTSPPLDGASVASVAFEVHRQLRSGESLVMTGSVTDATPTGNRRAVAVEVDAVDSENRVVLSGRVEFAWEATR